MSQIRFYTEEQVKDAIWTLVHSFADGESILQKSMAILTPIELPSDEEIFEIAPIDLGRGPSGIGVTGAFIMGAKWMKNKIQGGNK